MMRTILHLIESSELGGAEKMLVSLVERLDKSQYKSIICLHEDGWLNVQLQKMGFETATIPQNRSFDVRWLLTILSLIKKRKIILIHAHEFAMNVYGSMASAMTGIPIITTVHGKNYYWEKWRRRLAYRFASKQSTMVAVSEDIKKFLNEKVGIKNGRIITIYNGINTDAYYPDNELRGRIRKEFGINSMQPVIGTVGSLSPVKGHTYLLKAAAIVTKTFPDAVFLVAGGGELLGQLQIEASQLGIEKKLIFLGPREDIRALLQDVDIFILPSLSEGLPLSVLEAMACAKPVVATNVGGIPEVIMDGQTGFSVPPRNPEALAEKILLLLKNKSFAEKFGRAGNERVRKEFTFENTWIKYQKLYEKCLEDKKEE